MVTKRTIKAVIFDFDGLVVDTESPAYAAWAGIYQDHGQQLSLDLWVQCVGSSTALFDPVTHLASLVGRELDRPELIREKERRKHAACLLQPLMPGVLERLKEIQSLGMKAAVASSSGRQWVDMHVTRLGIGQYFAASRTGDDVQRVKPFPDLYLAAAQALGTDPIECLAFEDSLNGVKAAKAAGLACFAVPNPITCNLDFSEADGVLPSLAACTLSGLIGGFAV
jgi:putative hydrolase of the HAD superfamily